jgi:hypothetical protein
LAQTQQRAHAFGSKVTRRHEAVAPAALGLVLIARSSSVGIEHHDLSARKSPLNNGDEFLGSQIGETAIEEQNLPVAYFKLRQSVSSAENLLHRAAAPVQAMHHGFPQRAVRAGDEGSAGGSKNGHRGQCAHGKSPSLYDF